MQHTSGLPSSAHNVASPHDRRRQPRVGGLVLTPQERGTASGTSDPTTAVRPRVALWTAEGTLSRVLQATLRAACAELNLDFQAVATQEHMVRLAAELGGGLLLLVDCLAGAPEDIPRCDALAASIPLPFPIGIIHPRKEAVEAMARRTDRHLDWIPADVSLAVLLDMVQDGVARVTDPPSPAPSLTDREQEVDALAGKGCNTAQIAAQLGITDATVRTHRAHIRDKQWQE